MFYQMFYHGRNINKSHQAFNTGRFSSSVGCVERRSLLRLWEHDTLNVGVVGSSPTGTTGIIFKRLTFNKLSVCFFNRYNIGKTLHFCPSFKSINLYINRMRLQI